MPSGCPRLLAIAGFAVLCDGRSLLALSAPSLGTAASFAVLGGTAVTNSGATIVTGNLGVRPGGSITGFPPGVVKVGSIRNDLAQQAQTDASAAYNDITNQPCSQASSQTLGPGVYCLSSVPGTLTLDAAGDKNAVWIFRSSTLATAPGSSVQVINGGYAGNIFWQVSDSATLGAGTIFAGNILARNSITFGHGASLSGRALALSGTVTLDTNDASLCCEPITIAPPALPSGKTGASFGPVTFTASGGLAPYTFSISGIDSSGLTFTDATLSGTPTKHGPFPVTVTATDALGCPGFRDYTIEWPCGTVVLDPPDLPKVSGVSQTITATGGGSPYAFTIDPLPSGITFQQTSDTAALLADMRTTPGCVTVTVMATDNFGCSSSRTYTMCNIVISCFPDGVVGIPYVATITPSGGTAPYIYSTGNLPPGLSLTGSTISGTPTKPGCYLVTVTVTDANGFQSSRTCTICISEPLCAISPDTLPDGVVGTTYPQTTITATDVSAQYTCSVTGNVPPGLSFANCTISGTPTKKGCFTFTVTVTDDHGVVQCSKTYKVCIPVICAITLAPETLPAGIVGTAYPPTPIAPSGGTAPYGYSVSGNLPGGLTFTGGTISGTPVARGCFTFTVTTTDANGCQASRTYTICVTCPDISISPTALPNGNIGTPYNQLITASGGTGPYTFSLASGSLPPGLTLSPDGTLSGTPTTTGPYCFSIQAVDSAGCAGGSDDPLITISAASCPPGTIVTLTPPGLPEAQTNAPYAQLIIASGGTPPYTFAVTAGTLPPGLTLSSAGLVSGTPTASGSYNLTITATDANGCVGSTGCSITLLVDIPLLSGWGVGVLSMMVATVGVLALRRGGR